MNDPHPEIAGLGEHPRGTLAIVGLFGLLFFVGWLVMYFVVFSGRGHLH